jgi:hypothetical protein
MSDKSGMQFRRDVDGGSQTIACALYRLTDLGRDLFA